MRNKIGIRSVTFTIEQMHRPYNGSIDKLIMAQDTLQLIKIATMEKWAGSIFGEPIISKGTTEGMSKRLFVPLTFNRTVRNMVDHELELHIEAESSQECSLRVLLNISALDDMFTMEVG